MAKREIPILVEYSMNTMCLDWKDRPDLQPDESSVFKKMCIPFSHSITLLLNQKPEKLLEMRFMMGRRVFLSFN